MPSAGSASSSRRAARTAGPRRSASTPPSPRSGPSRPSRSRSPGCRSQGRRTSPSSSSMGIDVTHAGRPRLGHGRPLLARGAPATAGTRIRRRDPGARPRGRRCRRSPHRGAGRGARDELGTAKRAHRVPPVRRLHGRTGRPRDRSSRDRPRGDDRKLAGGTPDPGDRDRRRRGGNRRRPPGLRASGRPSRARVAVGGAADGVRHRPRRELRHRLQDHGAPRRRARRRDPGGERGRLHRVAELRLVGRSTTTRTRRSPMPFAGTGAYRRKNCRPISRGRRAHPLPGTHVRRRPKPQLRRVLGRARLLGVREQPDVPRPDRLLGARSPGRARVLLRHPPHRLHLQPHLYRRRPVAPAARLRRDVLPPGLDRRDLP